MNTVVLNGGLHIIDPEATQAAADAAAAFTALTASPSGVNLSGVDLGGLAAPLTPGTYTFGSSAQLTGTLNLDFTGHVDTPFIFIIGSTLTSASGARVNVVGGGPESQIYWLVGSSATLGTYTTFAGNILAQASITLNTGASILCGRALAITAAVSLDTASVSNSCSGGGDLGTHRSDFGSRGFSGAVPEPASWALMGLGIGAAGLGFRRRRNALANLAYRP